MARLSSTKIYGDLYVSGAIQNKASITIEGVVKLNSAINSTSTVEAATPSAVKQAYDLANHGHSYLPLGGGSVTGRTMVSDLNGYKGGNPVITFALGDNDTGFNSPGDGITDYWSNNRKLYSMSEVYHTGRKPTPAEIGAIPVNTDITITKAIPRITFSSGGSSPMAIWYNASGANQYDLKFTKANTDLMRMDENGVVAHNGILTSRSLKNTFISTGNPSGGLNGDVWIKYT